MAQVAIYVVYSQTPCLIMHSSMQSQNCMDQYAEIIGENAGTEDYHKIATHFENTGDHYKAGKFFLASKLYGQVSCFDCGTA